MTPGKLGGKIDKIHCKEGDDIRYYHVWTLRITRIGQRPLKLADICFAAIFSHRLWLNGLISKHFGHSHGFQTDFKHNYIYHNFHFS